MKFLSEFSLIHILLGLLIRLILAQIGHNHDVTAYFHVGEIVSQGQHVYAQTNKFNYGFIMAYVFGAFYWLNDTFGNTSMQGMHNLVGLLCSIFDILIALQLKKQFSSGIALLFYFNPVSLLITGYHSQFDNIAICIGLYAWFLLQKKNQLYHAILYFGIALVIKHVFLLFLPWFLFYKKYDFPKRILLFAGPICLFLISFLPFIWSEAGRIGVYQHVFSYNSFEQHSLISLSSHYIPYFDWCNEFIFHGNLKKYCFMLLVVLIGIVSMRQLPKHAVYCYLIALVAFSSGMTDQYLAICCVPVAILNRVICFRLFVLLASAYLVLDSRNNISGSIESLQFLTTNYAFLGRLLSVATCQLLLSFGLIELFILNKNQDVVPTLEGKETI